MVTQNRIKCKRRIICCACNIVLPVLRPFKYFIYLAFKPDCLCSCVIVRVLDTISHFAFLKWRDNVCVREREESEKDREKEREIESERERESERGEGERILYIYGIYI